MMSRMRWTVRAAWSAGIVALSGIAGVSACSAGAPTTRPAAIAEIAKPPKVLYLTHSAGFKHSCLGLSEQVVAEMGRKSGAYEATCLEGYKQDAKNIDLSMLTEDYLKQYDAIMLFTTGELPLYYWQTEAIKSFVADGKALIGVHSATDTFYKWPAFEEMIGGHFRTHTVNDNVVTIRVEDTKHPATKMLGDEWRLADEIYQFRRPVPRDTFHILMSIDTGKTDLSIQKMDKEKTYDIAWCRLYGKGRVFYTALGHREDVWTNPTYQAHVLGGMRWALGEVPGDATPSAVKKSADARPVRESPIYFWHVPGIVASACEACSHRAAHAASAVAGHAAHAHNDADADDDGGHCVPVVVTFGQ